MEYKKLSEICDVRDGTHDSPKYVTEGYPLVTSKNIVDGKLDLSVVSYLSQDDFDKINARSNVDSGDIIMPMIGTIGNPYLVENFCEFAIKNVALIKFPDDGISNKYIWYYLKSPTFNRYIEERNRGGTQKFLALGDIREVLVPYLPIDEQNQIVEHLDKVFSVIKCREQELELLDELIKARFIELFGDLKTNSKCWPIVGFKDCAEIDTNMIHDFEGYEEYPHIGIDSIEKDTGRLVGYRTIAEDGVISGKYLFSPRHIIYSKIRPNLNKVALPDFDGLCSADAYPILVKEELCTREFFGYTLRSAYFLDYILAFSSRTNLPKVNKNQVEGFTLPLPEIGVQRQFTEFVKQVDKSKVSIQSDIKYIY